MTQSNLKEIETKEYNPTRTTEFTKKIVFYTKKRLSKDAEKPQKNTKIKEISSKFKIWLHTKQAKKMFILLLVVVIAFSTVYFWGTFSKVHISKFFESNVQTYILQSTQDTSLSKYESKNISVFEGGIDAKNSQHYRYLKFIAKSTDSQIYLSNLYFSVYSQNTSDCQIKMTLSDPELTNPYITFRNAKLYQNTACSIRLPIEFALKNMSSSTTLLLEFIHHSDTTSIIVYDMLFV